MSTIEVGTEIDDDRNLDLLLQALCGDEIKVGIEIVDD